MEHILELKGISKHYGKVHALKNVELTLDHGIYALLGPNGSGKSTLMNILAGLLKPTEGIILYRGTDILQCRKQYHTKIGYMPQYPASCNASRFFRKISCSLGKTHLHYA